MIDRSTMEQGLSGVSFPASRLEIFERAWDNGCPADVLGALRDMQLTNYRSKGDVLCHLGDMSACS